MSYDYFGLKFQKVPVKEKKEKEKLYIKEKEKREKQTKGEMAHYRSTKKHTRLVNLNNYQNWESDHELNMLIKGNLQM